MRRGALIVVGLLIAAVTFAQVPVRGLDGRFVPQRPGAGIDADAGAVLGLYVKSVSMNGDTLTVVYQDAADTEETLTYTPSAATDHVVDSATWDASTKTITLETTDGLTYTVTLAELLDEAEVDARIASEAAQSLVELSDTPSAITADRCLVGNSAATAVVFASCATGTGTGDGVVSGVALGISGPTVTIDLSRTEGLGTVSDSVTLGAGNIPNLGAGKITSGTLDDARIPSAIARDSELPDVTGFLDESEVDARVATYARATPTGTIADAQIPAAIARDTELGVTVQDSGTQEGTGIETLNFGTNLAVAVASGVATITGQAGGSGGGVSLSDDDPEAVSEIAAAGTGTEASRSDHQHAGIAWGVQIDTQIVPQANEDGINTARISLRTSALTHYLAFLDWTAADLARVDHLPVGGHIGLRQGGNTRILRVEDTWESAENRYQVTNVNSDPLTEAVSGTDTELLLTTSSEADGVVSAADYDATDGVLTLTRTVGTALTVDVDEIIQVGSGSLPDAEDNDGRIALSGTHFVESINNGHDKVVTFKAYGPTRTVLSGEPQRDSDENDFAGSFDSPPTFADYDVGDWVWDRGSQLWIRKESGQTTWIGRPGPTRYSSGSIFSSEAEAARHIYNSNYEAAVVIIGTGSAQRVEIVTDVIAAVTDNWIWEPIGLRLSDINLAITGRLSDDDPGAVATAAVAGTSTDVSRATHQHAGVTSIAAGTGISVSPSGGQGAVTVTATGGGGTADGVADSLDLTVTSGVLSVTVGRSGTLADLVDDVTLPSGGVSTVAFHAGISTDTAITSSQTTWTQVLQLGTADINDGSFTVESQTDDTERVCVPDDGLYVVRAQIGAAADANTTQRFTLESRFTITPDGGTETAQDEIARQYNRGRDTDAASGATNLSGGHLAVMYDLDADDCIGVQTRTQLSAINYTVQSAVSYIEIAKQQVGAQGPTGPAGADGADGADGTDGSGGLTIAAYSSSATYSRGSDNSFVTDGGEFYIYVSGSERSSDHNPGEHPEYWFRVSHGAEFINIGSGSHRYKAGTFLLVDNSIYLATTNITTPRAAAYVIANAGDDQEFLLVNGGGGGGAAASDAIPEEVGETGAAGTVTPYSRGNHVHVGVSRIEPGTGISVNRNHGVVTITGTGTGLSAVATTANLSGDGTSGDPLDIADGGVTTAKLADDAVTGAKIADNTIHGGALIDGTIATGKIGDSQVTGAKLSSNAVSTGKIADDAVTTVKLDNEAVTTAKIDDGAVTTDKLADGAVTQVKLGEFSVVTNKIANLQVTSAKLAADAAGEGKVPIDNTLQFDGSGDLGVQISTVIDLLDEDIRYYSTDTTREDARQASKGIVFLDTSRYAKRIHSVEWDFEGDGVGHNYTTFFVRIDSDDDIDFVYGESETLFNVGTSGTRQFDFDSSGLRIPGSVERLGLFITRTGSDDTWETKVYRGQPASDSPRESYPDASVDFPFWRSARFASGRPEPGEHIDNYITNGEIYGYPKIRYTLELEHASLVGDGNISAAHIDSGSAANETVLQADGSGGSAFLTVVVHGDNIVDNTIPTAKYGNETVTAGKLSSGSATDGHVATADGSGGVDYEAVEIGGVTHVESGATYNNNVITVQTTGTVRGGDGILFAVPSPFGTSTTQTISLEIDGQANSEFPLHDRNGDALHEDDLTADSVYIAISDADSWDILVLPDATGTGGSNDGVVNAGTYDAGTITLTRTESLTDVTITGLPQVGGSVANPNATRIVTGAAWDSGAGGNESVTITDWRECDLLMPIFHDSSESAAVDSNTARPNHAVDLFFTAELDADGSVYLGVSQNEGVRVLELSDTSDVLSFQWVGSSPAPSQNDTMDVWCLNAGGVNYPGGEESDSTVGSGTMFDETTIDVPSGTWAFVNFGVAGGLRLGEWHRFLVADLEGRTDGTDDGVVSDANALTFLGNEEAYFHLGKTSGDKVLVGASMATFLPGTVRIRSN